MDVKKEIPEKINGRKRALVVTPDIGKVMFRKSMGSSSGEHKLSALLYYK